MSRKPIELRFAYEQNDGTVLVQTGYYLFNTATLQQVYELAKRAGGDMPDFIELHLAQFEEGEDDGEQSEV